MGLKAISPKGEEAGQQQLERAPQTHLAGQRDHDEQQCQRQADDQRDVYGHGELQRDDGRLANPSCVSACSRQASSSDALPGVAEAAEYGYGSGGDHRRTAFRQLHRDQIVMTHKRGRFSDAAVGCFVRPRAAAMFRTPLCPQCRDQGFPDTVTSHHCTSYGILDTRDSLCHSLRHVPSQAQFGGPVPGTELFRKFGSVHYGRLLVRGTCKADPPGDMYRQKTPSLRFVHGLGRG